jgi:benzoate transport
VTSDIRKLIDDGEMSTFQVVTIILCVFGNLVTGFAILILPFTSPAIAEYWQLPPDVLGTLLSASLLGMMVGALFIAPTADRVGRRGVLIFCMVLITAGLLFSAYATDANMLMIARVITGLGTGGSLAGFNTLVAEYSSNKWRDLGIGFLISVGSLSGVLGGAVTAYFVSSYDWQAAFAFGAVLAGLMTLGLVLRLPESVDYLLARRPTGALTHINKLLARMNLAGIEELPEVRQTDSGRPPGIRTLFSNTRIATSILSWVAMLSMLMGFYFVTSWTPKLLVDAGWTIQESIMGNILINAGGAFAGIGFGYASRYFGYRAAVCLALIFVSLLFVVFGFFGADQSLRFILAPTLGFFVYGAIVSQYALLPRIYEPAIRNTGTGWATGVGRLGAIAAPWLAGQMLAAGWDGMDLYFVFALTFLVSLAAVIGIWKLAD